VTRHIHHLTITTGHSRRSWRHEIEPDVLALTRELLVRGLEAGRVDVPAETAGHWMRVTRSGRCLLVTVMHGEDLPLVTFGVAAHSRGGAQLWRLLCEGAITTAGHRLDPDRPPQEPWCAARLEPGIGYMLGSAEWLGDFERCLAWAWLDLLAERAAR